MPPPADFDALLDDAVRSRVAEITDDLLEDLGALLGEAGEQEQVAGAARKQALATYASAEVKEAAANNAELAQALEAARAALKQEDATSATRTTAAGTSIDAWSAELKELRALAK